MYNNVIPVIALWAMSTNIIIAQSNSLTATIIDRESAEPLIGATLYISQLDIGVVTDIDGVATAADIPSGTYLLEISYIGYHELDTLVNINDDTNLLLFSLNQSTEELEDITIRATRSTRTIKRIPTRVEFIGGEELEEKAIMNAANISMVLRESTGIQIQQTSLSSGNSTIRIQGLDGRYTQLLKDGFPLFGGFSGGLSVMQIPPLDLAQFEVIKGSSSTLYGGGAIAGLVNMVSKQPDEEQDLDILMAQTHTGGSSGNIFWSNRGEKIGYTLYAAGHYNQAYNPDEDNFTNIPKTRSISLNPKIFYYPDDQTTLWFGINATIDQRDGGDIEAVNNGANSTNSYIERNKSDRLSTQLVYHRSLTNGHGIEFKNSFGYFNRSLSVPDFTFAGEEWNSFSELNYTIIKERSETIIGTNLYTNAFTEQGLLSRDQQTTTVGGFINQIVDLSNGVVLETGLRTDYASNWGVFALPRLSLLWNLNDQITARLGGGMGYKIPDLFTEEAAALNFRNITPIDTDQISPERSTGFNVDFNYTTALTEELTLSINQLLYTTSISNALLLESTSVDNYQFINAPDHTRSIGFETNIKLSYKDFRWFLNYAFIDTKREYIAGNPQIPLTPKNNGGSVMMYENQSWRIGYELYYTGHQFLSDNTRTADFITMGLLVQRHFDWGSPYVNFENFTDRRQSRYTPEVLGSIQNPIFPEIYAPTDGFVFTVGVHIKPFGREEEH